MGIQAPGQEVGVAEQALVQSDVGLGSLDDEFVEQSRTLNKQGRQMLTEGFLRLGLSWIPSHGNFVCVKVGKGGEVFQRLLKQGVIVRPIAAYGMPEYLRVSIGTESENARFLSALATALK